MIEALAAANRGMAGSYGADNLTGKLAEVISQVFGIETAILPVISGTAANALSLSVLCPADGAVACHEEAHIERDERGAPEFYTGGGKLRLLGGADGKIDLAAFRMQCDGIDRSFVHETPLHAISMTNLTECGTAYTPDEIAERAAVAKSAGLAVHLDGARLGNALVSTGTQPADMTWRAGVDVLSLGFTKAGALGCEVICLFGEARQHYEKLRARAKRGGHLPPKMRFLSAQALAMLEDGLWLDLARHGNTMATRLADACVAGGGKLAYPVDGNEVFVHLPENIQAAAFEAGLKAYPWPGGSVRFVCHWNTSEADIEAFAKFCQG